MEALLECLNSKCKLLLTYLLFFSFSKDRWHYLFVLLLLLQQHLFDIVRIMFVIRLITTEEVVLYRVGEWTFLFSFLPIHNDCPEVLSSDPFSLDSCRCKLLAHHFSEML